MGRAADVLAPRHQVQIQVGPPVGGRCSRRAPARSAPAASSAPSPSRFEMRCTCVSTQMLRRLLKPRISTRLAVLRPTPGSVSSSSIVPGTRPPNCVDQDAARLLHVLRLGLVEADRVDELGDLADGERRHPPRRGRAREQPLGGRRRGRILRPRREQRRDEHLERVFALLLGDLLDDREFEARDGAGQPAHHPLDVAGRGLLHAGTGVSGGAPPTHREDVARREIRHRGPRLDRRAAEVRREHHVLERRAGPGARRARARTRRAPRRPAAAPGAPRRAPLRR